MTAAADSADLRETGAQVAALCWRRDAALEILLITSLHTRRWILPKGWREPGVAPSRVAAREAWEEAGVTGDISEMPLGTYQYLKMRKTGESVLLTVEIFPLRVRLQHQSWPEKGVREAAWLSPAAAADKVPEQALKTILAGFRDPADGAAL